MVAQKDVIKIIKGGTRNVKEGTVTLGPRSVIEMKDAAAKKLLQRYPKDCEPWGVDAVAKAPVKKAQNSKQNRGHQKRDIV